MSFSENLAQRMKAGYETKYSLAKSIGVSQSTVANWLDKAMTPQFRHVGLLAAHYGCTTDELLKEDDDANGKAGVP